MTRFNVDPKPSHAPQALAELLQTLSSIEDAALLERFLRDLCTPGELRDLTERWVIARLLADGKVSYRAIAAQTGASLTTITRVARCLFDDSNGGYREIIGATIKKQS
jgi:TrpR-related protein YerC/YecD